MRVEQANIFKNASYRLRGAEELHNELHNQKYIHIHDKDYNYVTYNCLGVEFEKTKFKGVDAIENMELNLDQLFKEIVFLTNEQSGGIGYMNIDKDLSTIFEKVPLEKAINSVRRLFKNLNLPLRNGYERAYISFNLGLDTSNGGKKVIKSFLTALMLGDIETGEPFVFPNIVFKIKDGINLKESDENYELLRLANRVTGKRMNPTYFNCDSQNLLDLSSEDIGIMGCRTLLLKNINGKDGAIRRGNIANISINLPKIALESENEEEFYRKLGLICEECKKILLDRYNYLCSMSAEEFRYIICNDLYLGTSETLEDTSLKNIFSNGTLAIGFIGLFDCISYLKKEKITYENIINNLELAENILKYMRAYIDKWTAEYKLNFSLLATSGEGISGRFAEDDERKDFYTNSFHIPVYIEINPFEKLNIEAKFVKYCNGGEISYIEFPTPVLVNGEAIYDVLKYGIAKEHIYMGINFPLDYCLSCGNTGVFKNEKCDKCGSKCVQQLRRVSGYLSYKENLSSGKVMEEKERVSHFN